MINCCFYWDFEEANNAQQSAKRSEKLLGSDESEERKDEKKFHSLARLFRQCCIKAGGKKFKDARIPRGKALAAVKMCAQRRKKIALMSRDENSGPL